MLRYLCLRAKAATYIAAFVSGAVSGCPGLARWASSGRCVVEPVQFAFAEVSVCNSGTSPAQEVEDSSVDVPYETRQEPLSNLKC